MSDEGVKGALTDSPSLRDFVGIDLSRESVPDATTLLGSNSGNAPLPLEGELLMWCAELIRPVG
ncbi:MAG: transposase [Candidatus Accumulibacter similis]|nr:MAG: transposase [Candidatus Accumulibacter similis]